MGHKNSIRLLFYTMGIMGIGMSLLSFDTGKSAATEDGKLVNSDLLYISVTPKFDENEQNNYNNVDNINYNNINNIGDKESILTPEPTKLPNILLCNKYPDINDVVERYYSARLDSSSNYEGIVTNPELIDAENMYLKTEYIKTYHDIVCYTKTGIGNIDYIVYITYNSEIPTIDTYAISIDEQYIKLDKNNNPLIYNDELTKEEKEYAALIRSGDDVAELIDGVNKKLIEQMESDGQLEEFLLKLMGE